MNDNDYNMALGKNLKPNEQFSDMHVCTFCDTKFNNVNSLNLHCQLHDNNKNFTCLMCKEVFFDLQQLKLHDLRHSIEEAHGDASNIENISFSGFISCSFCGENFSSDEELINHCVVHPVKDAGIANMETSDLEDLNSESCDSDEEQLSYRILRQEIISPKNGRSHKQLIRLTLIDKHDVQVEEFTRIIKHKKVSKGRNLVKANNIPKKIKAKPKPLKAFYKENEPDKCDLYDSEKISSKKDEVITNNLEANRNLSDNEGEVLFDKVVNSSNKQERKSKLVAIRKKLWNDKIELPAMRKIFSRAQNKFVYKCKKCRVVFNRLDALNRHKEKDCSPPNLRVCHDCNKSFTNLSEYNRHCQAHKEIGKFSCDECKEEFTTKSMYRQHVIDHHGSSEKSQYDCRICNEQFVIKSDLDSHWYKHLNLKRFICCQCQRTFKSLPIFKIHVCSRDNVCHICQAIVSRRSHLLRHLRNVHKLDLAKITPPPSTKDSSVVTVNLSNSSSVVVNGEKLECVSDSSVEPKLQNEEDENDTKVEGSGDTEDKSGLKENETATNDSLTTNLTKVVNSRTTNSPIKKTLVKKKPNSGTKSNVSMKRKVNSSDANHNHARPSKIPKLKISETNRKPINKKVLLKKKMSVMNVKTKSKISATRHTIPPQRKQPVKKLTVKSSKKSLPMKKANNKFMNKSVTSKKLTNQKKGSVKIKKNMVQKKAGKSVSTLNSVKKLKKSKRN